MTGAASIVAGHGARDPGLDVGARVTLDRSQVWGRVARDGAAVRTDHLDAGSDPLAQSLRRLGASAAVAAPIVVSGQVWGVIVAAFERTEAVNADTEARIAEFTELVATAIANAQSTAELAASRRRIVETADDTRRRIERDLHHGAQQRLVHTIITLELARSTLPDDDPSAQLVSEALEHAHHAIAETRELAQGIHPAILSRHGLVPALEDLVDRSGVPVTLDAHVTRRLPASVEVTAYYVVSEALTNVAKHANASSAQVSARRAQRQSPAADRRRRGRRCRPLARLGPAWPEGSHRGERWHLDPRKPSGARHAAHRRTTARGSCTTHLKPAVVSLACSGVTCGAGSIDPDGSSKQLA